MHISDASGNSVARMEVVAHSAAQHQRKCEVLPLRIGHSFGPLGINPPEAKSPFKVGRHSPIAANKVPPDAHVIGFVMCFRSSRNRGKGTAEGQLPIAAENSGAANIVHLPSQGSDGWHQGVLQWRLVISVTQEEVENERNVDGKPTGFHREFELVLVIDAAVEIGGLGFPHDAIGRLATPILAKGYRRLEEDRREQQSDPNQRPDH